MMHENASNLVVKTVCELDIRVKSYREKTSIKKSHFCPPPLSPFLTWLIQEGAKSSTRSSACSAVGAWERGGRMARAGSGGPAKCRGVGRAGVKYFSEVLGFQ